MATEFGKTRNTANERPLVIVRGKISRHDDIEALICGALQDAGIGYSSEADPLVEMTNIVIHPEDEQEDGE